MGSDLTGLLGIVVVAGLAYVVLSNPDILKGNQNVDAVVDGTGDTGTDADVSGDTGSSSSGSGADCGKLCRLKDCSGYKKNCKTGCTYCCDSGPNSKPCGGGSSSTDVSKCPNCGTNQYRYVDSNGKCGCHTFGGTSTPTKTCPSGYKLSGGSCICSRTTAGCGAGKVARKSNGKCVCTSCSSGYKVSGNNCVCGQLSCCGGCPSGKRKVMNSGKCGCETPPSPIGGSGGTSKPDPCKGLTGATYTACRKAHGLLAKVSYHARPNTRLGVRMTIG